MTLSVGGKELTDYAIKEKISEALADGFIGEVHLAEVLAADPQYNTILPGLWQKFQLYIRDTKEPDMSTFGKRGLVWAKLLTRWTTGTIRGATGGREHTLLDTLKPGAIELQTLKDFFERWKIPLPSSLFSHTDRNPAFLKIGGEMSKKQSRKRFSSEMVPVKTSDDINWNDVKITFVSDEEILVQYAKESSSRNFKNTGFEDGRSGKPIASWAVLREAATRSGEILFTFENRKTVEKTVQTLNAKLSILFPYILGHPIKINNSKKRYVFEFKIASTI